MTVATYPTYDSSNTASEWKYGCLDVNATTGVVYIGLTQNPPTQAWLYRTMLLDLQPGTYLLKQMRCVVSFVSDTECDAAYFAILEDVAGTLTPVTLGNGLTYIDITADKGADASHILTAALGSVSVVLEAGKVYHWSLWLRGATGRTDNRPGLKTLTASEGPQGGSYGGEVIQAAFPTTGFAGGAQAGSQLRGDINVTTAVRKLFSCAYTTAATKIIPKCVDRDWWIIARGAVVADGQAWTCAMNYDNDGVSGTRTSLVLDMGATDQVTFGGANVALAGSAAEAGDTFYLGANFKTASNAGKVDLFYQNRTTGQGPDGAATDFCTISHACKNNAAGDASRGQVYTVAVPSWLAMSGTAAVAAVEVGWEPLVLFGDSQLSISSERLGYHLPNAFTHDRMYWDSGIPGNRLTETVAGSHVAGYLRYKATTPGQGDLCEMSGILFVFGGFGLNDISLIGTTETNRNKMMALMAYRYAEILDDLQDRNNHTLIIGLAPYSDGNASTQEAKAIQHQLNPMLEGLAMGVRAAYCNPWHALVSGSTEIDVPVFNATYGDGLHYNTVGAAVVAPKAAAAYETAILGGWWAKGRRREARQKGSLFPI